MKDVAKPSVGVKNVLSRCNGRIELQKRSRFISDTETFASLEEKYHTAARNGALSDIVRDVRKLSFSTSKEERIQLYANRFAREGSSGNAIYEELRLSNLGACAFCNARDATTLDHFLPKEGVSELAFLPANLVPACSRCNGGKSDSLHLDRMSEWIHPYFDTIDNRLWIVAEIDDKDPVPKFKIVPDAEDLEMTARVDHQFGALALQKLYREKAGTELVELRDTIKEHYSPHYNPRRITSYLVRQANGLAKSRSRNYWRALSYRAWAKSDWFAREGVRGGVKGEGDRRRRK